MHPHLSSFFLLQIIHCPLCCFFYILSTTGSLANVRDQITNYAYAVNGRKIIGLSLSLSRARMKEFYRESKLSFFFLASSNHSKGMWLETMLSQPPAKGSNLRFLSVLSRSNREKRDKGTERERMFFVRESQARISLLFEREFLSHWEATTHAWRMWFKSA